MTGQWGQSEQVIAKSVKAAAKIQSHWYQKFNFDCIQENEIYIMSIDGMQCETEEFLLDPNVKWYSKKKNKSRLMYEIDCSNYLDKF